MDKLEYIEEERKKIWAKLVELDDLHSKKTADYESEAKQSSKKASEFKNKSEDSKNLASQYASEAEEKIQIIRDKYQSLFDLSKGSNRCMKVLLIM